MWRKSLLGSSINGCCCCCLFIRPCYIVCLCAIELHRCPKAIKNTSMSHTVPLGDMGWYRRLFWFNPQMRVVSIKSSVCSCVSSVGKKNYSDLSLRGDTDPHSLYLWAIFQRFGSSVGGNGEGPGCQGWVRMKALLVCLFLKFFDKRKISEMMPAF